MFNFKKKTPDNNAEQPLNPHLSQIERAIQERNQDKLLDGVFEIIKENSAVYTMGIPEPDGRTSLGCSNLKGEEYLILITAPEHFPNNGVNCLIACKHMSQILDAMFEPGMRCGGLAVNPFTDGYFIFKDQISLMIEDARRGTWGNGIPEYSQCDLMTQDDLLHFACKTLIENVLPNRKIETLNTKQVGPRVTYILARQGHTPLHIVVQVDVAPVIPELTPRLRSKILENAKKAGAKCYYAPVSFGSTDAKRFEQSIALRGDSYYCSFKGLEEVF